MFFANMVLFSKTLPVWKITATIFGVIFNLFLFDMSKAIEIQLIEILNL